MPRQRRDLTRELFRQPFVIGIEQRDQRALGGSDAVIAGARWAAAREAADDTAARIAAPLKDQRDGIVATAIVDNDRFPM